jgi:hypothetical protein
VVVTLWWIWHIPLFIVLGISPSGYSFLEMVGFSLLIDSFFLLSGRNLLAAMFGHQGVNIKFLFLEANTQSIVGLAILLGTALVVRTWTEVKLRRVVIAKSAASLDSRNSAELGDT